MTKQDFMSIINRRYSFVGIDRITAIMRDMDSVYPHTKSLRDMRWSGFRGDSVPAFRPDHEPESYIRMKTIEHIKEHEEELLFEKL